MCEIWDEPFGDSSNIPTTLVSRLARKDVTVSLSADGGDEIFGGYDKYTQTLKYQKMFSKIPSIFGDIMELVNPKYLVGLNKTCNFANRYEKLKTLIKANDEIEMMSAITYYFNPSEVDNLLGESSTIKTSFDDKIFLNSYNNSIDKMMAIDYKTYQLDDILTKVDRATMSASLEGREPFLDHRVIEFVSQLPSSYKIKDGDKKYILKSIVHDYIPKEIMDRPKMGFSIPLNEWFGDELKKYVLEYLDSEKVAKTGLLNAAEVERLKKLWLENNSFSVSKIWLILTFMMWHERWMR